MRTGIEYAKLAIEKYKYVFFVILSAKGQKVGFQIDNIGETEAQEILEEICNTLPAGRYTLILSKDCNETTGNVKKGAAGANYVEIPIIINSPGAHLDNHSHNATSIQNLSNKEYRELTKEIQALEKKVLILEIENSQLKREAANSGIEGIMNNPATQNIIQLLINYFGNKTPENVQ